MSDVKMRPFVLMKPKVVFRVLKSNYFVSFCSIKTVFVFLILSFTLTLDILIKHLFTGPSGMQAQ